MLLLPLIFTVFITLINAVPSPANCIPARVTAFRNEDEFMRNDQGHETTPSQLGAQFRGVRIENARKLRRICPELMSQLGQTMYLSVVNTGVQDIDPTAFHQHTPYIKYIEIEGNHVATIDKTTFSNMRYVNKLLLVNNTIRKVHEDAFHDMPELEEIDLSANHLHAIGRNWFKRCDKLQSINLMMNQIVSVPYVAFPNLNAALSFRIILSSNGLRHVERGAFGNLRKFKLLQLRRNKLVEFGDVFGEALEGGKKLGLNRNNITCLADNVIESLKRFEKIRLRRNPISGRCVLKQPAFLRTYGSQFLVGGSGKSKKAGHKRGRGRADKVAANGGRNEDDEDDGEDEQDEDEEDENEEEEQRPHGRDERGWKKSVNNPYQQHNRYGDSRAY